MIDSDHIMPENEDGPRTQCIRCGTCCMKGGPTLHEEDIALFRDGVLGGGHVYTVRRGEVVRNVDDNLITLEQEIIKIKGQGKTWTCIFYDNDQEGCKIYERRPAECRALRCWDLRGLEEAMARPNLQRENVIAPNDAILRFIEDHEQRCSYRTVELAERGLRESGSSKAIEKFVEILKYDHYIRPLLSKKLGIDPQTMDFLFGRPLSKTIHMFGLRATREGDSFLLTRIEPHHS